MGVLINHSIAIMTSPLSIAMVVLAVGLGLLMKNRTRLGRGVLIGAFVWLWVMSCGWMYQLLGGHLEGMFPPQRVEDMPQADAIVVLGGGVGADPKACPYAEMYWSADRIAHAARLWKGGKAPVVIPSGRGETFASMPLLLEYGLPREAVVVENESQNTEQNAKFVFKLLSAKSKTPRILLVTSSWHMRRALLMFRRYAPGLEVVPAATDYEVTVHANRSFSLADALPSAEAFYKTTYMIKEYVGYWGYRFLRR